MCPSVADIMLCLASVNQLGPVSRHWARRDGRVAVGGEGVGRGQTKHTNVHISN